MEFQEVYELVFAALQSENTIDEVVPLGEFEMELSIGGKIYQLALEPEA